MLIDIHIAYGFLWPHWYQNERQATLVVVQIVSLWKPKIITYCLSFYKKVAIPPLNHSSSLSHWVASQGVRTLSLSIQYL